MKLHTSDLIVEYLAWCDAGELSPRTIEAYTWGLNYLPAHMPVTAFDLDKVLAGQDLATESKIDLHRIWGTFFKWLEGRHKVRNPMSDVRRPRRGKRKLPRVFTQREINAIWSMCRSQRDQAMIALLLDTGMRLGELSGLKWPAISFGYVHVDGKTGERDLPISRRTQELLAFLGDGQHLWTGLKGPMTPAGVKITLRRLIKRGGLTGKKLGPHTFRHTFATEYLRAGGNVFNLQQLMGHSAIATTQIYVHLVREDLAERHEEFSPLRLVWFGDKAVGGTAV